MRYQVTNIHRDCGVRLPRCRRRRRRGATRASMRRHCHFASAHSSSISMFQITAEVKLCFKRVKAVNPMTSGDKCIVVRCFGRTIRAMAFIDSVVG